MSIETSTDRRVAALQAAATMYQGQEVHDSVVLATAEKFSTFIQTGRTTGY